MPILGTLRFKNPETSSSFGAAAYLYWWWRSPTRSTDLGFPIFFSTRTANHAFTFALPLNFYWRHDDDASLLALPLFYYNSHKTGYRLLTWLGYTHRDGPEYSRSVAWLYWWGGDEKAHSSYHVLFPLVWDFEGKEDGTTVVFPLVWSFRSPTSNTTVVVPYLHVREGTSYFNALPPLWWTGGDEKTGRAHRLLVPFFYWDRAEHGLASHLVTPLGGYSRDDRDGTRTWVARPVSLLRPPRSGRRANDAHPALSEPRRSQRRFDGPPHRPALLPADRSARVDDHPVPALLAFLGRGDRLDARRRCFLSSPIAPARATRPPSSVPVYWRHFTNGGWSGGLFPIAYFGQNAGRGHGVVFPLYWHFASERSSTTVLFPLYYAHQDPHGSDGAVTPLFFYGHHDGESYAVLFPLFFHTASERQGHERHHHAARVRRARSRRDQRRHRPHHPAPLLAHRPRPVALRAAAALLVLRRPRGRQVDDRRRPLLAPALGRRDDRRTLSAVLLPARRAAGRQRREEPHRLPALLLPPRRADAPLRQLARRLGAHAERQRRASSAPTSGSRTATSTPGSFRCSTPTSCAAATAST